MASITPYLLCRFTARDPEGRHWCFTHATADVQPEKRGVERADVG